MTLNRFLKVKGHPDKGWVLKHRPLRNINLRKYGLYRNSRDHRSWPERKSYGLTMQNAPKYQRIGLHF